MRSAASNISSRGRRRDVAHRLSERVLEWDLHGVDLLVLDTDRTDMIPCTDVTR